jgi:benzoate-CoA ligase family protein
MTTSMQTPWVRIDSAGEIAYSPGFNVALPFIDRHASEGRGSKVAIRTRSSDVTYAELAAAVNRAANALAGLGIARGARVVMIVKDCPEFFYLFWGTIKAGIVPVPVNTLLRAKDYAFIIADSECAAVVYSPEFAAEVEPALAASAHKPAHVVKVDGEGPTFAALSAEAASEFTAVEASPEAECFWLYSSGSTGSPKGAVHLHRDMVVTSHQYGTQTLGVTESDVCFSAAKLFFAYGLGNGMTFPLWAGATSVLLDGRPTPESTFETIEAFKPTLYFGVPTLYGAQLQALERLKPDLSSVRYCVSAGEALPPEIFRRWKEETGLEILDGIGSTEALHIFISNRPGTVKPGSSGTLVPGYEAIVVDENRTELPTGEPGWLLIRGGSMAKYYWRNPEKTAATMLAEGWLNTGDTYYRDADGYFFYCGRSDDMLKVGGIWCSPFEIESTLIEHPDVGEVAVAGRADDQGLIKPEAWIVLRDGAQPGAELEADLLRHCKAKMAPYKYPRHFHFVNELPKTATGKIQRFRLRDAG